MSMSLNGSLSSSIISDFICIFSEAEVAKIPLISFGTCLGEENKALYRVKGNFKNVLANSDKSIFFIGLSFLFKNARK